MEYRFKKFSELLWWIGVSVGTTIATILVTFDPSTLTTEQAIRSAAIGILGASIRAAAGAILSFKSSS